MTYKSTKELLESHNKWKSKLHILKTYINLNNTSPDRIALDDFHHAALQTEIVESCLNILTEEEKFIIELHIMNHYTWGQIEQFFEEKWGKTNGRSERTLKRMQENALKKITTFINESNLEQYIP